MKKFVWVLLFAVAFAATSVLLAEGKLTMDDIKILTPKKKSDGQDTVTPFAHKKHAEEYAKGCEPCHPALQQAVDVPEHDKNTVHEVCKNCHAKDKPAKSFKCSVCHVVPTE